MARKPIQIEQALINSIQTVDPGQDVTKGPIRGVFIQPQAQVVADTESIVDDLALRYSRQYVTTRKTDVLDLYAFNHGMARGSGSPSKVTERFCAFNVPPPGASVFIPQGTVVTSIDGTVSFQSDEDILIASESFPAFYNSVRRRYEIPVPMSSIGVGQEFEVSAGRLTNLTTSIRYIDFVDQPEASSPSQPAETNPGLGVRLQAKFIGLALGAPAGLESTVRDYDPDNILDVAIVYSTDLALFKRPTRRPAVDVYLVGRVLEQQTDTFRTTGTENSFTLTRPPVASLQAITVNGEPVTARIIKDTRPAFAGSTQATDRVELLNLTDPGSTVEITYQYNKLITDTQDYLDKANVRLWEANLLVREAVPVGIGIKIDIIALSTSDALRIRADAETAIFTTINLNTLGLVYYPTALVQAITSATAGISNVVPRLFQRTDQNGIIPIDTVETLRTEYAFVDVNQLEINVLT